MNIIDFSSAVRGPRRLSLVTCYDYSFARLLARTAVDALLVGDSAAMTMHGFASTISADVPMMAMHTSAVVRGAPNKFVIADMPFLSFRKGLSTALDAAAVLMRAGAHAVKLEGVDGHEEVVRHLVQSGVPVMGHVGLQPQSIYAAGPYRVQGRTEESAHAILRQALELERLGAFAVVLECVPAPLAKEISDALDVPTIGIGAGPDCDGQILVLQDLLGMNVEFEARFVRKFGELAGCVEAAVNSFDSEVKAGTFPSAQESYS